MDIITAILIWVYLLLPTHWPILVAGLGTALYSRKLRSKEKFFVVAWIVGYGVHGVATVPWPLIWVMFFNKQGASREDAVLYLCAQSVISALVTLWVIHVIATKYWHRLFSSNAATEFRRESK